MEITITTKNIQVWKECCALVQNFTQPFMIDIWMYGYMDIQLTRLTKTYLLSFSGCMMDMSEEHTLHVPIWTSSQQDLHQHRVTLSRPILRLLHKANVLPVTFAVRRLSIAHRFCREEVTWHAVNFYCNHGNTLERRCTLYKFVQHVSVTKGFTVALFNIVIAWSLPKISWFCTNHTQAVSQGQQGGLS